MDTFKFFCEKCNYGTNLKSSFNQHNNTTLHLTGVRKPKEKKEHKIYKCDKCNYTSKNVNNYLTHTLNNHDTIENRKKSFKYYCTICDFGVFTESLYKKHVSTKSHIMKIQ